MTNYCPVCGSANTERRVTPPPKSKVYCHCKDCGSNFGTPGTDALTSATDEPMASQPEAPSSSSSPSTAI